MRNEPPKWADWFVERICPDEYLEEVQGDLHEAFQWRVETKGTRYAKLKFAYEALRTIQLFKFKSPDFMKNLYFQSLKSYFKTGFRFLWKTRTFSSINIFGLSLGIASATIAFLFLSDQLSFDSFHENSDQLYRLTCSMVYEGETQMIPGASYIMGEEIPKQVPGILKASHIKNAMALRPMQEDYAYQIFHYADRALFDMLDFEFISGGPERFEQPDRIVISESFAATLPQTEELTLVFGEQEQVFTITGIYKDMPNNSSLRPEMLVPFAFWKNNVPARRTTTWFDINMNVFLQKKKGVTEEAVLESMNKVFAANFDVTQNDAQLHLQPFSEMHMNADLPMGNGLNAGVNHQVLRVVLIIGILCLLISCFNYANFATGNYLSRVREVAIRKVMGANKTIIFQQFITESFLSSLIAGVLSIILIILILPAFSIFVDQEYQIEQLLSSRFVISILLIIGISTLIAGIYPSLVLASQRIGNALKAKLKVGGNSFFGWFLVMIQVSLTIFLIIGMITVSQQLNHLINFDLGYEDDNTLLLTIRDTSSQRVEQMRTKLAALPFVQEASANSGYNGTDFTYEGNRIEVAHLRTDPKFIDLLNIEVKEGRNFDATISTDAKQAVVVNEALIKAMKLEDPIGKQIPFDYGELENPRIVGVVKDFHMESPKSTIEPLVMYTSPEYQYQIMLVKFGSGVDQPDISAIEEVWRSTYPRQPINYYWLDEINANYMETEASIKRISQAGSLIAILLASLGLFGIVGTHVRQRLKEVSIRKVNGASPLQIYWLFSKKFSSWLGIGFVVGLIPAIYFLNNWLNDYPERIHIGIFTPALGILICGLVFLTIITILLYKVIRVNPAVYLKDE